MPGTLYVIATPIGNLEDLTERAARLLREVDVVAAESPSEAAKLLRHVGSGVRCLPYNDRNRARATAPLVAALREGRRVGLISDAGTPGLSDPGRHLVEAAVAAGVPVVPVPGASAVTALLSVAGLRLRTVRFLGFLPRSGAERRRLFTEVAAQGEAALAFESPHRLLAALADLAAAAPGAHLIVGRELTKVHEEIWRGAPAEAVAHFAAPRGEFTLLIVPGAPPRAAWTDDAVREALTAGASGGSRRDLVEEVAARSGRSRREVYALAREQPGARGARARSQGRQ